MLKSVRPKNKRIMKGSISTQDQLILDASSIAVKDNNLFAMPAISSAGNPCFEIREADVRKIGLPTSLQSQDVAGLLEQNGYKARIVPVKKTNQVRVPLDMAKTLKKCGVALVDEAYAFQNDVSGFCNYMSHKA